MSTLSADTTPSTRVQPHPLGTPDADLLRSAHTLAALGYGVLWGERATLEFLNQGLPLLASEKRDGPAGNPVLAQSFLLRRALPLLFQLYRTLGKRLTPPEQIMLDALGPGQERLEQFDGFFHRLPPEDQALLFLHDALKLSGEEIALAFQEPQASLQTRREQAIRALLDWIYADRARLPGSELQAARECFWIQSELFAPSETPRSPQLSRHLSSCEDCARTQIRSREILQSVARCIPEKAGETAQRALEALSQKRASRGDGPPAPGEKPKLPPLGTVLKTGWSRTLPSKAQLIPWLQRPSVRSWLAVLGVLLVLLTVPRLRALYETHLDRKLESYFAPAPVQLTPDELARAMQEQIDPNPAIDTPPSKTSPLGADGNVPAGSADLEGEEAVEAEDEGETEKLPPEPSLRGGVWRFHLKTHSPKELRNQITQYLKGVEVLNRGRNSEGIEAPGGVQFDFTIPKTALSGLRDFLKATVEKPTGNQPQSSPSKPHAALESAPFTWYRGKSTIPVPTGQAKVIIWLSQI